MARIPRQKIEAIVQRDLPGYEVVDSHSSVHDAAHVQADQATPDIDDLRRKFLGEQAAMAIAPAEDAASAERETAGDDDELVVVKPEGAGLAPAKRVIVSGRTHRVIGSQG
jgi:hypothetical protein